MRTFTELSELETLALISRVNEVLYTEFKLSNSTINAFWGVVEAGILRTEIA